MRRFASPRRPIGLAVLLFATAAACGDEITPPGRAAGYYRLVSVNGQALPYISPPSMAYPIRVSRGELVLRPNGTYIRGVGGSAGFGFVAEGTYRLSGRELVFRVHGDTIDSDVVGQVSGDSISFASPALSTEALTFTFRRAQLAPSTVPSDRYRLRSINGRADEPLVAHDTTIGDNRSVGYVAFDSVFFSDGVFFRRHRAETTFGYIGDQVSTVSSSEWTTWGAYESGPGWVVLVHYHETQPSMPARDSLSIVGDTLVRRTPMITGIHEERYTRP